MCRPPIRGRGGYFWVPRGGVELGIELPASEQEKNTVAGVAMSPTGCEPLPGNRPTSLPSLAGNDSASPVAQSCWVGRPGSSETGGFCARISAVGDKWGLTAQYRETLVFAAIWGAKSLPRFPLCSPNDPSAPRVAVSPRASVGFSSRTCLGINLDGPGSF